MTREEFFSRVDALLGEQHTGTTIGYGRWRRGPGSGRYPGRGLIRWHGPESIMVLFHTPVVQEICKSPESALTVIQKSLT